MQQAYQNQAGKKPAYMREEGDAALPRLNRQAARGPAVSA